MKPSKYRPRTWVRGYSLRVLTLDLSQHITRRLLSYLSHQEMTPSRHGPSYQVVLRRDNPNGGGRETVEISAPRKGVRLHLARLDIGTLKTHHETSTELSAGSGADALESQSIKPGPHSEGRPRTAGRETVDVIGPAQECWTTLCGS